MTLLLSKNTLELEQLIEINEDGLVQFFQQYNSILNEYVQETQLVLGVYSQNDDLGDPEPPKKRYTSIPEFDGGSSTLYCDHKIPAMRLLFRFVASCVPLLFLFPMKLTLVIGALTTLMNSIFIKSQFTEIIHAQIIEFIKTTSSNLTNVSGFLRDKLKSVMPQMPQMPQMNEHIRRGKDVALSMVFVGVMAVAETIEFAQGFLGKMGSLKTVSTMITRMINTSRALITNISPQVKIFSDVFTMYLNSTERYLCSMVDYIALKQTTSDTIRSDVIEFSKQITENYKKQFSEINQTIVSLKLAREQHQRLITQKENYLSEAQRGRETILTSNLNLKELDDLEFKIKLLELSLQNDISTIQQSISILHKQIETAGGEQQNLEKILQTLETTLKEIDTDSPPDYSRLVDTVLSGGKKRKHKKHTRKSRKVYLRKYKRTKNKTHHKRGKHSRK